MRDIRQPDEPGTGHPDAITETIVLPNDADAAAIARRFVAEHSDHLAPDLIDDAQLLVSEIVTNAVRYGRPELVLTVCLEPPTIDVAVTDTGGDLPRVPADLPPVSRPTGRGLIIVDAIAGTWGVRASHLGPGKTVWFDLTDATWQPRDAATP